MIAQPGVRTRRVSDATCAKPRGACGGIGQNGLLFVRFPPIGPQATAPGRSIDFVPYPMSNALHNLPAHLLRPHMRPFHPALAPAKMKDQSGNERDAVLLVLHDPLRLSPQPFVMPLQGTAQQQVQQEVNSWMGFLRSLQGELELSELFERMQVPANVQPQLVDMVRKLDEMGYVWGPTSEAMERTRLDAIRAAGRFTIPDEARAPEVATQLGAFIDGCLAEADDPELGKPIAGLVVPQLVYGMCKATYGAAYKCAKMDAGPRPDRVVILGTNHFGLGDGVVMTEFAFETPFGTVRQDAHVLERVRDAFGDKLFKDQLDFSGEHSVAHQLPWIQRIWGDVPVVAVLVPDPGAALIEDDGARIGTREFAPALRRFVEQAGGRTVFLACADLSRRGPQFGDQKPVDAALRNDVEGYDREMIGEFMGGAAQFLAHFEKGNPNHWNCVGSMWASLVAAPHAGAEMVRYEQVVDPQGAALVSTAAVALLAG